MLQLMGMMENCKSLQAPEFVLVRHLTYTPKCAAQSLLDIMNIHEGSSVLKFSDDSAFSASELSFIIIYLLSCQTCFQESKWSKMH